MHLTVWSLKMKREIIISLDGLMWVAVWNDFQNLQESPAGFGNSPQEALEALIQETGVRVAKSYFLEVLTQGGR
jgi:hypothetical protein